MSAAAIASDDTPKPSRFGTVIALVHKLIHFGKDLAAALQQPDVPSPVTAVARFGADTIPTILARIARGLLRAQVLQERLQRLAARKPRPPRPPAPPSLHP